MIVGIRTDAPEVELVLADATGEVIESVQWEAGRSLADHLVTRLTQLLQGHRVDLSATSGIVVYPGPGSFTGLRIGLTVANTIAYANHIPIVAGSGEDWFAKGAALLKQGKGEQQVLPEYGAEPNITRPRK